jgi:hypothetical protein
VIDNLHNRTHIYSSIARGTSEPGPLGVVCGDPVLARIKRELPGVNVIGYPVQVRNTHFHLGSQYNNKS